MSSDSGVDQPKKQLSRELGLASVFSIATGTMMGAGVFVLPGIAVSLGGPSAILSFLIASLLALVTGLSASELATAMPRAGGTYHFLDRALGPTTGTVAGLGTWSLSILKGAFAAVASAVYLQLLFGIPVVPVALVIALLLLIVNIVGVRHTGLFQSLVVGLVLLGTAVFAVVGLAGLRAAPPPVGEENLGLVVSLSGLVLFGFVGVIKATAVAGEVRSPGRNMPRGILLSLAVVTLLYLVVVAVVASASSYPVHSITAIVDVAGEFMGPLGGLFLAAIGALALVSMTNASILAAARYGYAMAHDRLLPSPLGELSPRLTTPHVAILVTGVPLLFLVAFVDVLTLAELTGVFTILLFFLYNAAVMVMRRSSPSWYKPTFRSPGYPWVHSLGMAGTALLLIFMGWIEQAVALAFVLGGVAWYLAYGKGRTKPRGELREVVRREVTRRAIVGAAVTVAEGDLPILLPIDDPEHARDIIHLASWLTGGKGAFVRAVKVERVPPQTPLYGAETLPLMMPRDLLLEIARDAVEFDVGAEFVEVFAHDPVSGIEAASRRGEFKLLLLDWDGDFMKGLSRRQLRRLLHHPKLDVVIFRDRGLHARERVLLGAFEGPYDELEVHIANGAASEGGQVTLLRVLPPNASEPQMEIMAEYHTELEGVLRRKAATKILQAEDPVDAILSETENHDLLVMRIDRAPKRGEAVFGGVVDRIARRTDCSLILTSRAEPHRRRWFRWLLYRSLG